MNKFVDLPEEVEIGIVGLIAFVVGALFAFGAGLPVLGGLFAFLAQYQLAIVGAVGVAFIKWLENALPGEFEVVAVLALKLILAVLAFFGIGQAVIASLI